MKRSIKNARLVDGDIPGLRKRIITGQTTVNEEADRYGVGVETIRRAVRGETFRHIRDFLDDPHIPGHHAEHATRDPLPEVPADLAEEARRSLKKVQDAQNGELEREDSVDFFLDARKGKIDPTKGGKE